MEECWQATSLQKKCGCLGRGTEVLKLSWVDSTVITQIFFYMQK